MENFTKYSKILLAGDVFLHTSIGYVKKDVDFWNNNLNVNFKFKLAIL